VELVRKQPTAQIHVEVAPDTAFTGTVDLVSPTVDRESRSVRFRYRVANPDLVLRDGMLAQVDVELQRHDDVVVAPADALVLDPTQRGSTASYAAYVVQDDKAHRVSVERGLIEDDQAEVLGGLDVGDRLVVAGFHMLEEGTLVEVVDVGGGAGDAGDGGPAAGAVDPPDAAASGAQADGAVR
jgi:RND family efflux transporter MFP subunit